MAGTYAEMDRPVQPGDMVQVRITYPKWVMNPYTCKPEGPVTVWYPVPPLGFEEESSPFCNWLKEPIVGMSKNLIKAETMERRSDFRCNIYDILKVQHRTDVPETDPNPNGLHMNHLIACDMRLSMGWALEVCMKANVEPLLTRVVLNESIRTKEEIMRELVTLFIAPTDAMGRTPLDYAKEYNNFHFIRFVTWVLEGTVGHLEKKMPRFWKTAPKDKSSKGQAIRAPWMEVGPQLGMELWGTTLPLKQGCLWLTRYLRQMEWGLPTKMSFRQLHRVLTQRQYQGDNSLSVMDIMGNPQYALSCVDGYHLSQVIAKVDLKEKRMIISWHGMGSPYSLHSFRRACGLKL